MQLASTNLWYPLLHGTTSFLKSILQANYYKIKEADLNSATRQLQVTKNYLVDCRCDDGFQEILTDVSEIAKELEILPNFETEEQVMF